MNNMALRVSCVISAYNEAARIGGVLDVVTAHPDIDETIVVDDGSTDDTARVVRKYDRAKLVSLPHNVGKSRAILEGIARSRNDLLLFIDADLSGLSAENVSRIISPVRSGAYDMALSLRKNSLLAYRLIGCDFVSGERIFSKRLLAGHHSAIAALPPFGFEVFVNRLALDEKLRVRVVRWEKVTNPSKSLKRGFLSGFRSNLAMTKDIFKVITPLELLQQNYFLAGFR